MLSLVRDENHLLGTRCHTVISLLMLLDIT